MKSIKHLLAALTAAVAVTAVAHSAPVFASSAGNPNDPAYWETQLGDGASCVKHNPGDTTADGVITDAGTSVTLNAGNWALLVVNSGAAGPDGNGNLVYNNPVAGFAYFGPLNSGGQQGNVSHWIVCSGPTAPQPESKVTSTEWVDGAWECDDTTVEQTRTVTTTPYVLVGNEWQLDDANAVTNNETRTRPLTSEELASCVPDQPEAKVTSTEWVDGAWECGDTTVEQTRTTTVTDYVLVEGQWQLDEANAKVSTETRMRSLTADEQFSCDVAVVTQSPAFVDPTCDGGAEIILPETTGVTYTASGPAAAGATITVTATAQSGYVLTGQTEWTHTFTTIDESQCVDSGAVPPPTETPTTTQAPTTTTDPVEVDSDAPTTSVAPTNQLPKTGDDHVTLVTLVAALLLGGGVALSATAARRRS